MSIMVYRKGSRDGHPFDYKTVEADDYADALASGWFESPADIGKAGAILSEVKEAQEAVDDVSPATRDELEQKARELGIGFNARTSDAVLAQRIAEKL